VCRCGTEVALKDDQPPLAVGPWRRGIQEIDCSTIAIPNTYFPVAGVGGTYLIEAQKTKIRRCQCIRVIQVLRITACIVADVYPDTDAPVTIRQCQTGVVGYTKKIVGFVELNGHRLC